MRTRLLVVAALATAVTGVIAGGAGAAQPGLSVTPNQLLCFDGTSDGAYGLCSITGPGAANLDNETNDKTGANDTSDQYSGVYFKKSALAGKAIGRIRQLGFSYTGTATAGSPRISLPIDTNNDGAQDGYAFISAAYCNDGAGHVDAVADPTCTIYFGNEQFDNLAAMAVAHSGYRVATKNVPFVIADDPGTWSLSSVRLGQVLAGVGRG